VGYGLIDQSEKPIVGAAMDRLLQLEYYQGTSFKVPARALSRGTPAGFAKLQESAQLVVSTECAEKVEAMLSTAVLHLADLWNMLTLEGVAFDSNTALLTPVAEISPLMLVAMKTKLENSLEWCQLARRRLTDVTTRSSSNQYVYTHP
jgi:hypothetical protein